VQTTCDSLAIAAKIKSEFIKELQNKNTKTENIDRKTTGYTFWNILNWFIVGVIAGCFIGFQLKISIDGLTNN